jgi:hypothetical protein
MAQAIEHNAKTSKFGGAAVIVPPEGGGAPIELLILDASGDPAQFWATIVTRAKMVIDEVERKKTLIPGFGMR